MLSVASVLTSLLLAGAGAAATATTVEARAARCNPDVAGKQINIVNGQLQLGFPSGAYFPNAPLVALDVAIPLRPVFNVDPSGNGLLTQVLYPTINANLTQVLLQPRITTFPGNTTQGWFFNCDCCDDPQIAYGCTVQSTGTGQCAVIGNAAGRATGVQSCSGPGYGNQAFDVVIASA